MRDSMRAGSLFCPWDGAGIPHNPLADYAVSFFYG